MDLKSSGKNASNLRQVCRSLLFGCKEQITVATRHFLPLSVLPLVPFSLTVLVSVYSRKHQAVLHISRRQNSSQEAESKDHQHVEKHAFLHLTAQLCWLCRCVQRLIAMLQKRGGQAWFSLTCHLFVATSSESEGH